jgi:hypothetical protein
MKEGDARGLATGFQAQQWEDAGKERKIGARVEEKKIPMRMVLLGWN